MKIKDRVEDILTRPFPEISVRVVILINALVGVFVVFFLSVFQPFGIANLESNSFLICLGFGLAGFASSLLYEFVIAPLVGLRFSNNSMNFGKWMIYMLGILVIVSLGNFLYARSVIFGYIDWQFLPAMIYGTLMIGFFPIVLIGWFLLRTQENKYQNIADELNRSARVYQDELVEERTILGIPLQQVRYIQAFQNYVRIGYIGASDNISERTERSTLKNILNEVEDSPLVRCHRSYIVNRKSIISTSGNAQGLRLALADCTTLIPVSRTYVPLFRSLKLGAS